MKGTPFASIVPEGARGLGTMESNEDKLFADRMKNQALGQSLSKEMKNQALGQSLSKEMKKRSISWTITGLSREHSVWVKPLSWHSTEN